MPLSSNSSYHPVLLAFLNHWQTVNAALPTPFLLRQGTRADAVLLADELEQRLTAVAEANVAVQITAAEVQLRRAALRSLLEQWGRLVQVYWAGTPWAALVPDLPPVEAALDKFLRPFRDALRLWVALEAEPAPPGAPEPLRLGAGETMDRAAFAAAVEALRQASLAWEDAGFQAGLARAQRDVCLQRTRALLMDYTHALPARVGADSLLLSAMPRLWPTPGHTPEPVTVEASWQPGPGSARIEWTASDDALLSHYEVRACAGPDYAREDETVLATVEPTAARVLDSPRFLSAPGAVASYRVYVVLSTGNERGSETVVVQR